jgi:hypothetical protein
MPAVHAANGVRLNTKVTIESIQSQPILRLLDFLWQIEAQRRTQSYDARAVVAAAVAESQKCKRDKIVDPSELDWNGRARSCA